MATQRAAAQKAASTDQPGTTADTEATAKAENVEAASTDQPVEHTDTSVNKVAPQDGQEHGYIGQAHPDKNRDDYTVAGVTGGTAKADDKPQDGETIRKAWAPLQS